MRIMISALISHSTEMLYFYGFFFYTLKRFLKMRSIVDTVLKAGIFGNQDVLLLQDVLSSLVVFGGFHSAW